jgi:Ca2+-binding EF-hand superfamily protein
MWTIAACVVCSVVAVLWSAAVLVKSVSKKGKVSLDFDDFLALVSHMQELRLTFNAIDKDANGSIDHQVNSLSLSLSW